ncbi:hypothetical protein [Spirillospora sp. NPDC048823]|uniref:hypothetical protein n=1 Tax=unclassified Spirillospora TaxID=2642701 RepID=UPI003714E546
MNLSLKYEPVTANAPRFAADIVQAAQDISQVRLDYTVESLDAVDGIVQGIRQDGPPIEAVAETLFGFGCYLGEVLLREGRGQWVVPVQQETELVAFPFVVRFPDGRWANPLGKVFKRFEEGAEHNVRFFAAVMLNPSL